MPAHAGLQQLRHAAEDGRLAALCRVRGARLLVVFGSAVDPAVNDPHDLDLAVRFGEYSPGDVIPLLTDLAQLAGISDVDLLVLNTAGAVAREQALVHGEALYAEEPNLHAEEQIAATLLRLDTAPLRQLQLQLLAEGPA